MKRSITICVTGGHMTPALAVIDEIQNSHPDWKILFIGRKYALEQDSDISQEYHEIGKRRIKFLSLNAGRFRRDISLRSLLALLKFPVGFIQSFLYILRERPRCILSFGGYIGLPVAISGWLLGIPVVTHEQTHTLGIANRLMLPFVEKCLLSYEDTKYAPSMKSTYTGLPLRREIVYPSKTLSFTIPSGLPLIYITGGSTGAVSMNELIFPIINILVEHTVVIHQTGPRSIEKAHKIQQALPEKYQLRYIPMSYIEAQDVGWILQNMSLIVGRSGGNTVAETALVRKPAVFIPLPWAGQDEQEQNAHWYEQAGMAHVVHQEKATSEQIEENITRMMKKKAVGTSVSREENAATERILKYIELLVYNNEK
jgi:UDP-N-acetylglucosamine--N-acetylmuramyl-(pentapeptide) pyrophosphoryl-undecaprenol N-acetylglucosamine transferase